MSSKSMPSAPNGIVAIWNLLASNNRFYRAAGILLLSEWASTMTANGKGAEASSVIQEFRDNDPKWGKPKKGRQLRLKP